MEERIAKRIGVAISAWVRGGLGETFVRLFDIRRGMDSD
jgi:hypothetical protein